MKNFIGVDISKAKLDAAVVDADGRDLSLTFQVENEEKGIKQLLAKLSKAGVDIKNCWFCLEHTGSYGLLLCHLLQDAGIKYAVIPALEIKQSIGMQRGKNDTIDALRIAVYASTFKNKLKVHELPSAVLYQLKDLFTYRQQLVKMCSQFKNSIKHYQRTSPFALTDSIVGEIQEQIQSFKSRIKVVEKKIGEALKMDEAVATNADLAISVKGVGLMVVAYMLITTNNFQGFQNARQFNCYSGTAPFEHSSGSSIRGKTKVSQLGNKTMKTLLYNAANSAAQHDSQLKNYYLRKKEEGKHHQSVMNAIACKLVGRVFAVIKRQTPFVETYENKFNKTLA